MAQNGVACPNGHINPIGNRFCAVCGAQIIQPEEPTMPPAPPPTPTASALPPPFPGEQRQSRKRLWIALAVVAFVVIAGVAAAVDSGNNEKVASSPAATATPLTDSPSFSSPTASSLPSVAPAAVAKGTYGLRTCDVELFTHGLSTSTLVGSTEVNNTGTVQAKITVTFEWLLAYGRPIKAKPKTITLPPGRSRTLLFNTNINETQVGAFQAHPGYQHGKNCKTKASIKAA